MSVELQELLSFHRTGKNRALKDKKEPALKLRPALFADYSQLSKLRYDYPLVLLDESRNGDHVISLMDLINEVLRLVVPPGTQGTRVRQQVLALELKIRELLRTVPPSKLGELWRRAEKDLLAHQSDEVAQQLQESWDTAWAALRVDGLVVDCDSELPEQFVRHFWRCEEALRTKRGSAKIDRLILKLGDILTVDELKSESSRTPRKLRDSLGSRYQDAFDFDIMAELLNSAAAPVRLPAQRKKRIKAALATLKSQHFFKHSDTDASAGQYGFQYRSVSAAMAAWYERLPDLVALNNAIAVAELEIDNRYCETRHDLYLGRLGAHALSPADLAFFPSYLVSLSERDLDSGEQAILMDALSSDLPLKILLRVNDILGSPSPVDAQLHNGVRGQQFAAMTVGLNDAFVVQGSSSNLYHEQAAVERGINFGGPALFSIYAGSCNMPADLPVYLSTAAAIESRAFPAYSYDPSAAGGLACRYDIEANPQLEAQWVAHEFIYEDEALQRVTETLAFTMLDFATLDVRYADYFADVPKDSWHENMRPAVEYLELAEQERQELVPYVVMIDDKNCLHRLVVDDMLIRVAARCAQNWDTLREFGGINNSYAQAAAERVSQHMAAEKEQALEDLRAQLASRPGVATSGSAPAALAREPEQDVASVAVETIEPELEDADPEGAYIETPRCTTCDECTARNARMFAYDENKQAYIADLTAGTYRDLVEAAENCQVAIIHPGKPLDPKEAGLEDLLARAADFS